MPALQITIDASQPETHRLRVKISGERLPRELRFPVWTPGSYLVREYARHITDFKGGKKQNKNTWVLSPQAKSCEYEVYAFERTVRTSFLDQFYAALNGATLLPILPGTLEITLLLPKKWKFVASALGFRSMGNGRWRAKARDIDHWIDSPIIAAAPGYGAATTFRYRGCSHRIAWVGTECARPLAELSQDFQKIVAATWKMFGGAPFKSYDCLLHFGGGLYGGLEHRDSQLSQFDGATLLDNKQYDALLRLLAHEYFHSWNVKSIRPRALGPFQYDKENYTEDLWFAEGITDYFDDIIPAEAGLITQSAVWQARLKDIQQFPDSLPAHKKRSVGESSFDAWIRYYRPDEDSWNTDVSYYAKGSTLGWCWDMHLQRASRGKWTLAKVLRAIWREFGIDAVEPLVAAKPGFTRDELLNFVEKLTGIKQKKLVESWVSGRKPLPWRQAMAQAKLKISPQIQNYFLHYSGAAAATQNNTLKITKVSSGSTAEKCGLATGDEIIAIGDDRIQEAEKLDALVKKHLRYGKNISLAFCRQGKFLTSTIRFAKHGDLGLEYKLL